jgi:hypothetical protein
MFQIYSIFLLKIPKNLRKKSTNSFFLVEKLSNNSLQEMNVKLIITAVAAVSAILLAAKFFSPSKKTFKLLSVDTGVVSWNQWKQKYGVSFGTDSEDNYRKTVFESTKAIIGDAKYQSQSFTLGLNEFAATTRAEFKAQKLGFKRPSNKVSTGPKLTWKNASRPDTYDARDDKLVTDVKNQGSCGSCWAFSTVGAIEGAYAKAGKGLIQFSEQQIVDCDTDARVHDGNQGCNGGLPETGLKYVETHPIETEDQYKYTGRDATCHDEKATNSGKIDGSQKINESAEDMRQALYEHGAVSVGIEADSPVFQFYMGGVIRGFCGENLDHGVTVIGYGADYFIVKNSWGPSWGKSGFVNIGDKNCGIQKDANVAVVNSD